MKKLYILFVLIIAAPALLNAQTNLPNSNGYPKVAAYFSIVHPIVTISSNLPAYNFDHSYTVGFPIGVNILKSDHLAYSIEIIPILKSANGITKTYNLAIQPGLIFRYPNGFNILTRAAFETGGRYGGNLVFNKVFYKTKANSYWVSVPIPARFGNNTPASIGIGLQLGVTF
jgi:hypothetical protein